MTRLVRFVDAFGRDLELILHTEYAPPRALRMRSRLTKMCDECLGGDDLAQARRVVLEMRAARARWVERVRASVGDRKRKIGAASTYRIVVSSFLPGAHDPAARRLPPPGSTAHMKKQQRIGTAQPLGPISIEKPRIYSPCLGGSQRESASCLFLSVTQIGRKRTYDLQVHKVNYSRDDRQKDAYTQQKYPSARSAKRSQ